jgi:hypothetical protein
MKMWSGKKLVGVDGKKPLHKNFKIFQKIHLISHFVCDALSPGTCAIKAFHCCKLECLSVSVTFSNCLYFMVAINYVPV